MSKHLDPLDQFYADVDEMLEEIDVALKAAGHIGEEMVIDIPPGPIEYLRD